MKGIPRWYESESPAVPVPFTYSKHSRIRTYTSQPEHVVIYIGCLVGNQAVWVLNYVFILFRGLNSLLLFRIILIYFPQFVWNVESSTVLQCFNSRRHKGDQSDPTSIFCSLTDYQKLWHNCSLFVKTSFDPNYVTPRLMTSS